jgi:hypothetical protein
MMAARFTPYLKWLVAATIFFTPVLLALAWPMSYWFEVRTVHINDARVGEQITMLVDREVKKSFVGTYGITIHKWSNAGPVAYCRMSGGPWEYRRGAAYPIPLTLAWWTENAPSCNPLPAGQYQVTTRWVNDGNVLLPEKSISVTSNIFTVNP